MKILVLSDSHGNISNMEAAVEREQPRMILHLGDCWRDAERLAERYPEIPMEHVPGNCDCRPEEPAGQNPVPESRHHRQGGAAHLRRADGGERKDRRPDRFPGSAIKPTN